MVGHSKFKNIMRKGVRTQSVKILLSWQRAAVAARSGTYPDFNPRLRLAISAAKAQNMPIIFSAQLSEPRAMTTLFGEEVRYEGYGPRGVAVIVESPTDNQRASRWAAFEAEVPLVKLVQSLLCLIV